MSGIAMSICRAAACADATAEGGKMAIELERGEAILLSSRRRADSATWYANRHQAYQAIKPGVKHLAQALRE